MTGALDAIRSEGWPRPIAESLDRLKDCRLALERHNEILALLGSVLRTHCAIFSSVYLRTNTTASPLDRCLLTDLRRPTLGNQVTFLRASVKTREVPWGIARDLVSGIRSLLAWRDADTSLEKPRLLIDALLQYRNRTVHAGVGLRNDEAASRLELLELRVALVLQAASAIKEYRLDSSPEPTLHRGAESILLSPGFEENEENFLGVLEGWDSRSKSLHYIAAGREWRSEEQWNIWTRLLRRRGLLTAHWDEIDEGWLRARARTLVPERYRFPDGFAVPAGSVEKAWMCVEPDGVILTGDPGGTMALLCADCSDRIVFAVTPDDPAWNLPPHQGLTSLLGASPSLEKLPAGHPLESLASRVTLVLPEYGVAPTPRWDVLESDFAGLRIVRVARSGDPEGGFLPDTALLGEVRSAFLGQDTDALPPPEAAAAPLSWDRILRDVRLASLPGTSSKLEERLDSLLEEFIPNQSNPEVPEMLVSICRSITGADETWRSLLLDLGLVQVDPGGNVHFAGPLMRARLFSRALALAPDRQAARFLSEPPGEPEEPIADVLLETIKARKLEPSPLSLGEAMVLARRTTLGDLEEIENSVATAPAAATLWRACTILVRWRRPDLVASLASLRGQEAGSYQDPALQLEIGIGLRTHGSLDSAARFFEEALHRLEYGDAAPFQQQLAGILRDRGNPGDRESAARLYEDLLGRRDLDAELRLHATCGAAENLYLMERIQEAMELLERVRAESGNQVPRLRALVEHRLAVAKSRASLHLEALALSRSAVEALGGRLQGSFAARLLDSHARFLATAGFESEALMAARRSVAIKRALGDRRGLQITLLSLSALAQRSDPEEAHRIAVEAFELAQAAGDAFGTESAMRRLQVLARARNCNDE